MSDDGGKKLTTSETAERLGYGRDAVRGMCESGQLEAYRRPGGHWRIPEQSVQRFVEDSRPKVRRR
jgi:excisionase family DNA binding protein